MTYKDIKTNAIEGTGKQKEWKLRNEIKMNNVWL